MRQIEMVDLKQQYSKIKEEVDASIHEVLDTATFINGKIVSEFSSHLSRYLGIKHVIPCANGTDALQIALMALGLQPGDEVITPSFTYIATTEVIALLRLKPIFVEVDPKTFNIDPSSIEKAITPKTKAIVPVHLYGQSADMQSIMDIARRAPTFCDRRQCPGDWRRLFLSRRERQKNRHDRYHRNHLILPDQKTSAVMAMAERSSPTMMSSRFKLRMIANHGQSKNTTTTLWAATADWIRSRRPY